MRKKKKPKKAKGLPKKFGQTWKSYWEKKKAPKRQLLE